MEEHLKRLCGEMVGATHEFRNALINYLNNDSAYLSEVEKVRTHEATMDELRREMELSLFRFELLKYSQSDKLTLVEGLDDVADRAEIAARMLSITKPKIPKKLHTDFMNLMNAACETVERLDEAVIALYDNFELAKKKANETEALRRDVRQKEFALLEKVFEKKPDANSLLVKELASQIGRLADDAEGAADFVAMLSVKYRS